MYYFRPSGSTIDKYSVTFDATKLQELKEKVLETCSEIEHIEKKMEYIPQATGNCIFKNINATELSRDNLYGDIIATYYITYDKYTYPYLYVLVERLLSEDITVMQELYSYNLDIEQSDKYLVALTNCYLELLQLVNIGLVDTIHISHIDVISDFFGIKVIDSVKAYGEQYPSYDQYKKAAYSTYMKTI